MPFLQKSFYKQVDDYTLLFNPSVETYPQYAIEIEGGTLSAIKSYNTDALLRSDSSTQSYQTQTINSLHVEGTEYFYECLIDIFRDMDPEILKVTHDSEDFSFTIFDEIKLYPRVLNTLNHSANLRESFGKSIPCIFRKNQKYTSGKNCATRLLHSMLKRNDNSHNYDSYFGYYKTYCNGYNLDILTDPGTTRKTFMFSINIRYNTNFLNVSYTTVNDIEVPLLFIIKGHTIDNKNIYFMTVGGNTFDDDINYHTYQYQDLHKNQNYSAGYPCGQYIDIGLSSILPFNYKGYDFCPIFSIFNATENFTSEWNTNPFCIITNLYEHSSGIVYGSTHNITFNQSNLIMSKPIWLHGYADFDNILLAPQDNNDTNKNFEINGDTWWYAGCTMETIKRKWSALGYQGVIDDKIDVNARALIKPSYYWKFRYMLRIQEKIETEEEQQEEQQENQGE